MSDWLMKVIKAEAERLIALAAEDADLRAALRALAEEILAATDTPQPRADVAPLQPESGVKPASSGAEGVTLSPTEPQLIQAALAQAEPLRELTLGRSSPSQSDTGSVSSTIAAQETSDDDFSLIEGRCRLKAEGARWAAERVRRIREGTNSEVENAPMGQEIEEWAGRLTDCFYWMNASDASTAPDISLLDQVGGCFEAVAESFSLVRDSLDNKRGNQKVLERALPLIAEAQSALRAAFQRIHGPDDPDQLQTFEWLKATAARHHVYIKRFMRADDMADPTRWSDLLARIDALAGNDHESQQQRAQLNRVRDCLKLVRESREPSENWQSVFKAVEEMVSEGIPPSNREIRELMLPFLDDLPDVDDLPPGFRLVLREIDRFLAARLPPPSVVTAQGPTPEVKEAARLLNARSIVLIGGVRRTDAQKVLKSALGLRELIWIETKEHQSIRAFESSIARADVALVLLAIRWSSHAFGEVKQFCDRHAKPLVRLPAGYNPNQVAAQILSQCSEQLRQQAGST